ncbi:MAG: amidohydrolase family protein [Victivallales bacterium]|nr:amidohydrolase family protein [Victivallales bacterium]
MESLEQIPLLHDHHNHLAFYTAMHKSIDLSKVKDYKKALCLMQKLGKGINIVTGWHFYSYIKEDIEKLPPVLICDTTLHSFIMNSKGKEKLENRFPEIVENIENPEWVENNLPEILKLIPCINKITRNDIKEFFNKLEDDFIYSIDDMLTPSVDFIKTVEEAGFSERCNFWMDIKTYKNTPEKLRNKVIGIKLFLDGAVGTETAAITGYKSGSKGIKVSTKENLKNNLSYIESQNKAAAVHAIGDKAIDDIISVLEDNNFSISLIRLEHATYITKSQAVKCKKMGIKLCMQPNFSIDAKLFDGKVKKECLKRNNSFRMLIDEVGYIPGEDLLFGSDGMPHGAEAALENALFPIYQNQKLKLTEFVKGYCTDAEINKKISFKIINNKITNIKKIII